MTGAESAQLYWTRFRIESAPAQQRNPHAVLVADTTLRAADGRILQAALPAANEVVISHRHIPAGELPRIVAALERALQALVNSYQLELGMTRRLPIRLTRTTTEMADRLFCDPEH